MPVYFMKLIPGGTIKIGYTDDIQGRRQWLQRRYGCKVRLLETIEGGAKEERDLHRRFKHLRIGIKEQFLPANDLMDFINQPRLLDEDLAAVRPTEVVGPHRRVTSKPTSVQVTHRTSMKRRVHDEEQLKQIVFDEMESLSKFEIQLAFVIPSATVTANKQDGRAFTYRVRQELGDWHRWLNSVMGSGKVKRWSKKMDKQEYRALISGFFIYDNCIENFSDFEKQFRMSINEEAWPPKR